MICSCLTNKKKTDQSIRKVMVLTKMLLNFVRLFGIEIMRSRVTQLCRMTSSLFIRRVLLMDSCWGNWLTHVDITDACIIKRQWASVTKFWCCITTGWGLSCRLIQWSMISNRCSKMKSNGTINYIKSNEIQSYYKIINNKWLKYFCRNNNKKK